MVGKFVQRLVRGVHTSLLSRELPDAVGVFLHDLAPDKIDGMRLMTVSELLILLCPYGSLLVGETLCPPSWRVVFIHLAGAECQTYAP